jgi:hypothetical protein
MNKPLKGLDQQGRYPEAAEAATDVGQDEPNFYSWDYVLEEVGMFVVGTAVVIGVVAAVAFLIGRYV